jgi:hypothetical protein
MRLASKNREGLTRSLHWLGAFARSGIDIQVSTLNLFASLVVQFDATLEDFLLLAEATFTSIWLKSLGRQELQAMLSGLHANLAPRVIHCLQTRESLSQV